VKIQDVDKDLANNLGLKEPHGAIVSEVLPDGPAAAAGLKVEDAIVQVDTKKIDDSRDLARTIADLPAKATVDVKIWRDKNEQTVKVKLGTYPNKDEVADKDNDQEEKPDDTSSTVDLKQLGITLKPATAGKEGVVISEVDPNSDAATKGLREGDVILKAAGKDVTSPQDVVNAVKKTKDDGLSAVMFHIKKGGEQTVLVAVPIGKG
jgi:serine protease Do